jgi:phage I-like protein
VTLSYVIALSAAAARMPIAQLGVRYKGKQKIEITRAMLGQVVANFRKLDTGEVPIDYDHAIENVAGLGDAVPAAGWIKAIDDAPDKNGILWGTVEWTARAAAMIAAREYKYISPVIDPTIKDNKTGEAQGWTLTSAALTNQPVLKGMPALVLSEAGWCDRGDAAKEKTVKVILTDRAARTVKVVGEDGAESTHVVEGLDAPVRVLKLSDVKRDAKSQEYDFAALDCGEGVLIAGEVFRAQAQMVLSEAVKAGKILPAQRAAYESMALGNLPAFQTLVASMKPQVDLGVRGSGATEGEPAEGAVAVEIQGLVKAKIAASEGKTGYAAALSDVLRSRPDLAKAYKATMGGGK